MLVRLMFVLLLFADVLAALVLPAPARAQDVLQGETPALPAGVPVPPNGTAFCYFEAGLCITTPLDFQRSIVLEQQAIVAIRGLLDQLKAARAETERLKNSCAARLEVVPRNGRTSWKGM